MAFTHTFKYLRSGSDKVEEIIETKTISIKQAVKLNCQDCSGGYKAEVRDCQIKLCPLWPFRTGKTRPFDQKASERARTRFKIKQDFTDQGSDSGNDQS